MSDANRVALQYAAETTLGDRGANVFNDLRFNSEGLAATVNDEISPEIRFDRQQEDVIPLSNAYAGDISTYLSYGNLDKFLESAMYREEADTPFVSDTGFGLTVPVSGTHGGILTGVTSDLSNVSAGQYVYLSGLSDAESNGLKLIQAVDDTANTITLSEATPVTDITGSSKAAVGASKSIWNGVNRQSFTLEKGFLSLAATEKRIHTYAGCVVDTMALEFRTEAAIAANVSVQAQAHRVAVGDLTAGGNVSPTNPVLSAAFDTEDFLIDGVKVASTTFISELTCTLSNNLRLSRNLGVAGPADIRAGSFGAEGSFSVYFLTGALYDKFLAREDVSFAWDVEDTSGNKMIFCLPRVRIRQSRIVAGGINTDLIAQYDYSALRDPSTGLTMSIGMQNG